MWFMFLFKTTPPGELGDYSGLMFSSENRHDDQFTDHLIALPPEAVGYQAGEYLSYILWVA